MTQDPIDQPDNLLVPLIARIASAVVFAGFFCMLFGPLLVFIDRRALGRGRIDAFRKGWLILTTEGVAAPGLQRRAGKLQTAQGEGQWLTDDVFAFWSQANYRRSSHSFGWTGLATLRADTVMFEVRLLRGKAAIQAGQLVAVSAFLVLTAFADWRLAFSAIIIAAAMCWWSWRMFVQEKSIAGLIAGELRRRFEGERWA